MLQFWAFSDVQTGKVLMRVAAGEGSNNGNVRSLCNDIVQFTFTHY